MPQDLLRYVVLHHTGFGAAHFDLMVERVAGGELQTFRLPCWPVEERSAVTQLGDHRREYLTYEGPVSGGRGHVRRVADGACARSHAADSPDALVLTLRDAQLRLRLDLAAGTIEPWEDRVR